MIIAGVEENQLYFEKMFGMKEIDHYSDAAYDEPIMGFEDGAHLASLGDGPFLALFQPLAEPPLAKSRYPVVAIYSSEFDAVVRRLTDLGLGYRDVPSSRPGLKIIVATDPAGNAIEIIRK